MIPPPPTLNPLLLLFFRRSPRSPTPTFSPPRGSPGRFLAPGTTGASALSAASPSPLQPNPKSSSESRTHSSGGRWRGGSREAEGIPRPDSPFEPSSSPQGPSDSPQGLSPRPHTVSHTVRNCGRSVWFFSSPHFAPNYTQHTPFSPSLYRVPPPPPSYPARFSILPCSFLRPTLLVPFSHLPTRWEHRVPPRPIPYPPLLSLTPPLLTSSLTNGLSSLCSLPQSSFSSLAHTTTLILHSPLISLSPIDPVGTPGASMTPFLPHFPFLTLTVRPSTLDPRPPTLDPRTSTLDLRPSTFNL